ncbi:MAG: FlgN protein, partial [Candidatus Atribacteria bacterium]|nr:FlgN protein [Candidatus Atribacteria bacterium]
MIALNEFLSHLSIVLEKELYLQTELWKVAKEKRDLLLQNQIEELVPILEKEMDLVTQVRDTEKQLSDVWANMVEQCNLEPGELTLNRIIELSPPDLALKFREVQEELKKVIKALQEVNSQNATLIDDTLHYIDVVFSLLLGGEKNSFYSPRGK